jgi:rhodanese-related sulfurtransferase
MRRTIQRALIIVVAGAALGLLANKVSPRAIPYITPPKPKAAASDTITLEEATQLWQTGPAFFIDARPPAQYAAGHIANAFNVPAEDFATHYRAVAPMLTPDSQIVAYCDGMDCELSHQLAGKLRELGYKNVRILINGWTSWRTAGLPTQTGTQP